MPFLPTPRLALLLLAACLLSGCSSWKVNSLAEQLQTQGPEATLLALQKITPPDRDRVQYLLDLGSLKFNTGDFAGSIQDLQSAKQLMRDLQAVSVTETAGAATINETLRAYSGTPSERVLVHLLLAMNYLATNDFDGARVEMLQANVTMQELADTDSLSGQLASARFMAGLIYELGGEWDDAMISYRRALKIVQDRNMTVPDALATSLLNASKRQGFDDEYQRYVRLFGQEASLPGKGEGEIILLFSDGVVSTIKQQKISVYSWQAERMISIAVPHYPPANYYPRSMTISAAGNLESSEPIENIETIVREDLDAVMPGIVATTTARAVTKYYASKEASKQNDWAGIIVNIAGVVSEVADTRSWNMLPSSIQVARLRVPAGIAAEIPGLLPADYADHLQPASEGGTVILIASSLRGHLYSYHRR